MNDFVPGDPLLARKPVRTATQQGSLSAQVDVMIVGSSPAGLTPAAQMSAFDDLENCIVEQAEGPLRLGQADGIAWRTMEMLEAFDFSDRVLRESCWINEVTFTPGPASPRRTRRPVRVPDAMMGR